MAAGNYQTITLLENDPTVARPFQKGQFNLPSVLAEGRDPTPMWVNFENLPIIILRLKLTQVKQW